MGCGVGAVPAALKCAPSDRWKAFLDLNHDDKGNGKDSVHKSVFSVSGDVKLDERRDRLSIGFN
jgi:hypothetical protein